MKDKRLSFRTLLIIIALIIIITLGIVSSVIEIGERLGKTNLYLEFAFYAIIFLVVIVGIIYPIISVLAKPIFSLDRLCNPDGSSNRKWCKRLVNNLIKHAGLTPDEQAELRGYLSIGDDSANKIIAFFERRIVPIIDKEIMKTAGKVFLFTSISQGSATDMISKMYFDFQLVKRISEICGFRPNTLQVFRVYKKTLFMTLVAGTLEEINYEKILTLAVGPLGLIIGSALQGIINSFSTISVGVLTKYYILNADTNMSEKELIVKSITEAGVFLKNVAGQFLEDKIAKPVKKVVNDAKNTAEDIQKQVNNRNPLTKLFRKQTTETAE